MKNLKSIIIYGVIIVLCVAAFIGYLSKRQSDSGTEATATVTANAATAAMASETAAVMATETAAATVAMTTAAAAETITVAAETTKAAAETTAAPKPATSETSDEHIQNLMKKAMAEPDPNPVVGIGRGEDYAAVTEKAIKNAGGLDGIVKKGDVVLIKPNICTLAEAGSGKITDYRCVAKIAEMVTALGASKVIVAEGTINGNAFDPIFLNMNKYDKIKGVELVNLNACTKKDCYELKPLKSLTDKAIFIPKVYMDADVVITVAKLKTHFQPDAVVSLTLKNAYGVPPGSIYGVYSKDGLHALGLKESIIDINRIRKPEFAVIEGIVGGEGNGPLNNDPVKSDIIFAGRDLVALDTAALTFMGFNIDWVPHVNLASEEKLGISDLSKIQIKGADLDSIKMSFKPALSP